MRVISRTALVNFWSKDRYVDSKRPLEAWYSVAIHATWDSAQAVKDQYGNASIIANNRVVFNIGGNKYRLIVAFAYRRQACWIKFVGTHRQYDAVDAATVELE